RLQHPGLALAGFLPQLHPDRVQVLGNSEISYLATLPEAGARRAVAAVAGAGVACFVVTNGTPAPAVLIEPAEAAGIAVLATGLRTGEFIRAATAWLEERLAPETTLHAGLGEGHGLGILIVGSSRGRKSAGAPRAGDHAARGPGRGARARHPDRGEQRDRQERGGARSGVARPPAGRGRR